MVRMTRLTHGGTPASSIRSAKAGERSANVPGLKISSAPFGRSAQSDSRREAVRFPLVTQAHCKLNFEEDACRARRRLLWKQLIVQRECTSVCWAPVSLKLNLVVSADC